MPNKVNTVKEFCVQGVCFPLKDLEKELVKYPIVNMTKEQKFNTDHDAYSTQYEGALWLVESFPFDNTDQQTKTVEQYKSIASNPNETILDAFVGERIGKKELVVIHTGDLQALSGDTNVEPGMTQFNFQGTMLDVQEAGYLDQFSPLEPIDPDDPDALVKRSYTVKGPGIPKGLLDMFRIHHVQSPFIEDEVNSLEKYHGLGDIFVTQVDGEDVIVVVSHLE